MVQSKPITFRGVVARPGVHKNRRSGRDEKIIWEELKRMAILYKRIPVVIAGGSHFGFIDPEEAVGIMDFLIDEKGHKLEGEGLIFREESVQSRIPDDIKLKLQRKEFLPSSLTYTARVVEGIQRGRKPDHIAIGVRNPMHAGVGIHAEEDLPENIRWEETEGIGEDKKPELPEKKSSFSIEELNYISDRVADRLESRFPKPAEQPVSEPERPATEKEEPEKPPEPEKEEEEVDEEKEPEPEPRHEPEKVIPKGKPAEKGIFESDDRRVISTPITGKPKE